jgi:hypothetical protein
VPIFPQLHSRFHNRRQDGEQGLMCLFVYNGAGSWRECQSHAVCKCVRLAHSPSLMTTPSGRGPLMAASLRGQKSAKSSEKRTRRRAEITKSRKHCMRDLSLLHMCQLVSILITVTSRVPQGLCNFCAWAMQVQGAHV